MNDKQARILALVREQFQDADIEWAGAFVDTDGASLPVYRVWSSDTAARMVACGLRVVRQEAA